MVPLWNTALSKTNLGLSLFFKANGLCFHSCKLSLELENQLGTSPSVINILQPKAKHYLQLCDPRTVNWPQVWTSCFNTCSQVIVSIRLIQGCQVFLTSCFLTGDISYALQGHVALSFTAAMELKTSANNFYEGVLQADSSRDLIVPLAWGNIAWNIQEDQNCLRKTISFLPHSIGKTRLERYSSTEKILKFENT